MRRSIVMSALILVGGLALMAFVTTHLPKAVEPRPVTVSGLLADVKCRAAETKKIIIRGIEDDYSPVGSEPNFLRAERQTVDIQSFHAGGSYDQVEADLRFTDSIQIPGKVASGLFVVKFRPIGNDENDTIAIGNMKEGASSKREVERLSVLVPTLANLPGWVKRADIYAAEFRDIRLSAAAAPGSSRPIPSLLDFVRNGGSDGWIDIGIQDDTAVDVLGVAICIEPPRGKGLSLSRFIGPAIPARNVVAMSCSYGGRSQHMCDAYIGDTDCKVAQPLACFRPLGEPVPKALDGHHLKNTWSGGKLAFTEPVPGTKFSTIRDATAHCARRFGPMWRTAAHHDGLPNIGISGFGNPDRLPSRAWIDIMDQPYATCWAR